MGLFLFLLGVCFGVGLMLLFGRNAPNIGTLRIDQSDPFEGPQLFLELDEPIDRFRGEKVVSCVVKDESYISHE